MRRTFLAAALALAAAACGDSFTPSLDTVAGTYTASSLTTTVGGVKTDQLQAGGSITITLAADGTTTGQLFVPDGDEDGGDLTADLAGAWSVTGDQVTFVEIADTFIRDMDFTATKDKLEGDETFATTRVEITLSRAN